MSGKPIDGVVQALIEVAVGKVQHLYRGTCPDAIEGFDSRDPQCPACRVLTAAQQQGQAVCECPHLDMSEPPQHHDSHCPGRKRGQAEAVRLLREYRKAPKFSNDHDAIKRTVALEDEIDAFLAAITTYEQEGKESFWPKLPGSGGHDWTGHD